MANLQNIKVNSTIYTITTPFITCSTAAATTMKEISYTGAEATEGTQLCIQFTNGNTSIAPTLSLNGGTALSIIGTGSCVPAAFNTANSIMHLIYDGTQWIIIG